MSEHGDCTRSRRQFLAWGAALAGVALAPGITLIEIAQGRPPAEPASAKVRWGMLIDTNRCAADCNACVTACDTENGLSGTRTPPHRRAVDPQGRTEGPAQRARRTSLPMMCQHCAEPPCVDVCPTGASFKRADGIVLVDRHICIGCRYCMMACPYKARSFVHEPLTDQKPDVPRGKGCVESCTLCVHRVDRDETPACVEACAAAGHNAILFGDLNDPNSEIAKRVATLATTAGARRPARSIPACATRESDRWPSKPFDPLADDRASSRRWSARRRPGRRWPDSRAAHYMEEHGHIVTGMNNQIVWGTAARLRHLPDRRRVGRAERRLDRLGLRQGPYKARAPLSGLLCLALLAGGLTVLMLDLGRPDRLIVAMTHFNFKSVFAWNVFLYTGMFAIVAVYLWTLMERRMNVLYEVCRLRRLRLAPRADHRHRLDLRLPGRAPGLRLRAAGADVHRHVLRLGPGGRSSSCSRRMYAWNRPALHPDILRRMKNLLGIFVAAVLYFIAVHHLTNPYFAQADRLRALHPGRRRHLPAAVLGRLGRARQPAAAGPALPSALGAQCSSVIAASVLVIARRLRAALRLHHRRPGLPAGDLPRLWRLAVASFDGQVDHYVPSVPEIFLGLGGLGLAFLITTIGVRVLHFMPRTISASSGRRTSPIDSRPMASTFRATRAPRAGHAKR